MKRICALFLTLIMFVSIIAMAAGATSPAMEILDFEGDQMDGEYLTFVQGGALEAENYKGELSVVVPDWSTGFVTNQAYENFTIQFDVGGVSSASALVAISFGLKDQNTLPLTDGHAMLVVNETLQLDDYDDPNAPKRYLVAESIRPSVPGLDRYWPLSPDEHLADYFTDEGEFKFGYKRNTYKLVKDGDIVRVYRKNNVMGERGQELIFELVNTGWTGVNEEAGYIRLSFLNSDEFLIDNVCFSPEPYTNFPVKKNDADQPKPTEPAPTDPVPTEPAPTDPAPTDPAPTDPAPTDPTPTQPKPTDPAPTDPSEPLQTRPTQPSDQNDPTQPTVPTPVTPGDDGAWTSVIIAGAGALLLVIVAIVVALKVRKRR